jgi:hypothetical protein
VFVRVSASLTFRVTENKIYRKRERQTHGKAGTLTDTLIMTLNVRLGVSD